MKTYNLQIRTVLLYFLFPPPPSPSVHLYFTLFFFSYWISQICIKNIGTDRFVCLALFKACLKF